MDYYAKACELLQKIANSIYERDNKLPVMCFTSNEVQVVEEWLKEFKED